MRSSCSLFFGHRVSAWSRAHDLIERWRTGHSIDDSAAIYTRRYYWRWRAIPLPARHRSIYFPHHSRHLGFSDWQAGRPNIVSIVLIGEFITCRAQCRQRCINHCAASGVDGGGGAAAKSDQSTERWASPRRHAISCRPDPQIQIQIKIYLCRSPEAKNHRKWKQQSSNLV